MNKLKLLMAACALILGVDALWAQTDFTSKVATSQSAWGGSGTYGSVTTYAGTTTPLVEFYGSSDAGVKLQQTVTGLDKGLYDVTLFATSHNAWGNYSANLQTDADDVAYIFAKLPDGTTLKKFFTAHRNSGMSASEPYKVTINDIEVADGQLVLGLALDKPGQTEWQTMQIYQLTRTGNIPLTALVSAYNTALNKANATAATTKAISTSALAALNTAISTYSTVDETSEEALNTAIDALNNANSVAEKSIATYELIASGTIPTNVLGNWAITTPKGELACNTWSVEGNSDGSGMTTPFIQDWAPSGTALAGGNLQYTLEGLNPGEKYAVTALVRAFNESGTGVSGATYFVGADEKSIDEYGSACSGNFTTKGKFATFTCTGEVDSEGKLTFGVRVESTSAINWLAIKNVSIVESSGIVPTGINLDKTSASICIGEQVTLTATVTPNDAEDQTVIWTSSDETVATVSGGVVSALKAGTTTITATALAGDNVATTATITVTQADAPANYSEVAAGKFLIINAATGKALGGANSYGTQASLIEHAAFATLVSDGDNFKITNICSSANGLGSNGYVDNGTPVALTFTKKANGAYTMAQAGKYVTAQGGSTVVSMEGTDAESVLAQWYLIDETAANKNLAAATTENPVDVTYYIGNPNFSRNVTTTWTITANNKNLSDGADYNRCAESWQSSNGFNLSQELTVPNGTYKLRAQAATSGNTSEVVVFANDETKPFNAKAAEGSMTAMSESFNKGLYYTDWVEVTVTDHKLTVGARTSLTNSWSLWDNFELYMTEYVPVTAITATIDNAEFETGKTATITAAPTPETASFNALTYTSSDEAIATVNTEGVVTGVAAGKATITVKAEMENISKTVDVTVKAPAIIPTIITLNETEIALDVETTTFTLTAEVGPEGANQTVTYASSDETVATVSAEGVITAVTPGTATITVTSAAKNDITATANVTVTFPETAYETSGFANNGATRNVYTLGENLIKNGTFEYPNPFQGWKSGANGNCDANNYNIVTDGDNKYIQAKDSKGAGDSHSISTGWPIEAGKTYVFGYKVKANAAGNSQYHVVSMTNAIGTETAKVSVDATPVTTSWTEVKYQFTNTEGYAYVQFRARWLANSTSFDDFYLAEATTTTEGNVDYATAAIPTANIGTGAFQYSQDAIDAANALVQGTATVKDVEDAYTALTTVNEPADGQLFNVILTYGGWTYDQKAMTYIANGRNDAGNYNIQYKEAANQNLAQAFTFTKVEGNNNYKMSQIDADGVVRYISTGTPYNGNASQIRTTTNADDALVVTVIPTATEGKWNLRNTEAKQYIGSQDAGVFTVNSHIDFNIVETTKPSIAINTTAAGWGTVMLPFAVAELPEGVKAHTCAAAEGQILTLKQVNALEANKPYVIEGAWKAELTGDAQGTDLSYTEGLLTGVYTEGLVEVGKYVLQKNDNKVGFYQVAEGENMQPTIKANRAYLTAPANNARVAFFFDDETTGINAINALIGGNAEIFDANGRAQQRLVKGMNIIRTKDGKIQKVMVK